MIITIRFKQTDTTFHEFDADVPDDFPVKNRAALLDLILEDELNSALTEDKMAGVDTEIGRISAEVTGDSQETA